MEGGRLHKYDGREKIQFMKSKIRQVLLNRKTLTEAATWNVRTLYQSGKLAQLARERDRLQLDIFGVCETRCNGTGEISMLDRVTALFSGNTDENAPHERGVGLILSKKAFGSILEWEPVELVLPVIKYLFVSCFKFNKLLIG